MKAAAAILGAALARKAARPVRRSGWSPALSDQYRQFVARRVSQLEDQGAAMVCCDLAAKLVTDFAKQKKIADPLAGLGKWYTYRPGHSGGLPNVTSPHYFLAGDDADKLAKQYTRDVRGSDGKLAWDPATGAVDVKALKAGDILFYSWKDNGQVDHTVNVLGVGADGSVTIAYGTYDNLAPGTPLKWENLDMQKVATYTLEPGTTDYDKWLGPGNHLWRVRQFSFLADAPAAARPPAAPRSGAKPALAAPQADPGRLGRLPRNFSLIA